MKISKIDVIWNYIATFFRIASSFLLLPLVLRKLSSDEMGIWSIFSSFSMLVFLVDFGFNSSFSRNVTYVFSGVSSLKKDGYEEQTDNKGVINYSLLKGLLSTMRWFYLRASMVLFLLLSTVGTLYIHKILVNYKGNVTNIYIAWFLFICINTYNLFTLYYESLLEGKGLVKRSKQITTIGNFVYLIAATTLIFLGFGLIALVASQLISVVIIRYFSKRAFYTKELSENLATVEPHDTKHILQSIYPNAVKYGITSLGGFLIQKSSIFMGSLYLPLGAIAIFGITKQLMDITVALANLSLSTFLPQITNLRVEGNIKKIKEIYIKGILVANLIFFVLASGIILVGPLLLKLIKSNVNLDVNVLIITAVSSLIGLNSGISGAVISTRNFIPFVKPSILSGLASILLLFIFLKFTTLGLIGMALTPGIVDLCYQGWKWPSMVISEFQIKFRDVTDVIKARLSKSGSVV